MRRGRCTLRISQKQFIRAALRGRPFFSIILPDD